MVLAGGMVLAVVKHAFTVFCPKMAKPPDSAGHSVALEGPHLFFTPSLAASLMPLLSYGWE
jgi:hypothetical protein